MCRLSFAKMESNLDNLESLGCAVEKFRACLGRSSRMTQRTESWCVREIREKANSQGFVWEEGLLVVK